MASRPSASMPKGRAAGMAKGAVAVLAGMGFSGAGASTAAAMAGTTKETSSTARRHERRTNMATMMTTSEGGGSIAAALPLSAGLVRGLGRLLNLRRGAGLGGRVGLGLGLLPLDPAVHAPGAAAEGDQRE